MTDEVNLVLRSKILYCSLNIENAINNLLLKHLLIKDRTKTQNFANKAGISFQSKISLLFDIDVLTNDEFRTIELLMNFRNKFLHDIKYTNFETLLQDFDPSIRNKFSKYLDDKEIRNEESYEKAFHNLYQNIVDIINEKIINIDKFSNKKIQFLKFQGEIINNTMQHSLDLIQELNSIIETMQDSIHKDEILKAKLKFEYSMNFKENIQKFTEYSDEELIKSLLK